MKQAETKIKELTKIPTSFKTPFDAGYDAGKNGSNTINSDFRFFSTKESMQEWERGKKNAEQSK